MPRFDKVLQAQVQLAEGLVTAGETMRRSGGVLGQRQWTITRLESLYELAFFRVFLCWESCLESVFHRSLCGYSSRVGQEVLLPGPLLTGPYYRSLTLAETAVLGGKKYVLWHNPDVVVKRCQKFISSAAGCHAVQETVISSHQSRLEHIGAIRHRIAHHQTDAMMNFNAAALAFAGRTYSRDQPGRFLRDRESAPPKRRWLSVLSAELVALLGQMV